MSSMRGKWSRPSLSERFEALCIPEPNSGCWIWLGKLNPYGYGVIVRFNELTDLAHRVSLELIGRKASKGQLVCHRCDNRSFVNPEHLFVGSHADNSRDMAAKGRAATGERNSRTKLTINQVLEIKRSSLSSKDLSAMYGVCQKTVRNYKSGATWRRVR